MLEAAARVFARRGFHAATIAEVAAKAGIAVGSIYLYFDTKEQLYFSVVDEKAASPRAACLADRCSSSKSAHSTEAADAPSASTGGWSAPRRRARLRPMPPIPPSHWWRSTMRATRCWWWPSCQGARRKPSRRRCVAGACCWPRRRSMAPARLRCLCLAGSWPSQGGVQKHGAEPVAGQEVEEVIWRWQLRGLDGQLVRAIRGGELTALVHDCPAEPYQGDEDRVKAWVLAHRSSRPCAGRSKLKPKRITALASARLPLSSRTCM